MAVEKGPPVAAGIPENAWKRHKFWIFALLGLMVVILVLIANAPIYDSRVYPVVKISNGARFQIKSLSSGKFVRVPTAEEAQRRRLAESDSGGVEDSLLLDQDIGWLQGGTFTAEESGECFVLRSTNEKYVTVDRTTGQLKTSTESRLFADAFVAINPDAILLESSGSHAGSPYNNYRHQRKLSADLQSPDHRGGKGSMSSGTGNVHLKVCRQNLWLSTSTTTSSLSSDSFVVAAPDAGDVSQKSDAWLSGFSESPGSSSSLGVESPGSESIRSDSRSRRLSGDRFAGSLFELKETPQLKGVNMGGMFVPEVWMNPSFYNGTMVEGKMVNQPLNDEGTPLGWGGSLCRMVDWNREETEKRMAERFDSWFTESDFREIAAAGFNSIRVPIGYWNLMEDPHHAYAPADWHTSRDKLDWVFEMAAEYGLLVLIDLHGGPGSQNGQDHSGCSKAEQWDHPDNQKLSRDAVEAMASRYGPHPNLWGFELLNEPSDFYSANKHALLASYYKDSYAIIRKHSADATVVFNELYPAYYSWWDNELREPDYYNVVMDWHLYDWQQPYTGEWNFRHVRDATEWAATIKQYSNKYPIMVGEWCMSTGTYTQAGQPFVDAAVHSFADTSSWFIWNWKVEDGIDFAEWDVQKQLRLRSEGKGGLYPLNAEPPYKHGAFW